MKKLQEFAKAESKRLREIIECTDKEFALFNAIKLGEEVGEVNNEILKHFKAGRKNKLKQEQNLESELADVMIVLSIIAEDMNINLEKAIEEKIKIIEERYN